MTPVEGQRSLHVLGLEPWLEPRGYSALGKLLCSMKNDPALPRSGPGYNLLSKLRRWLLGPLRLVSHWQQYERECGPTHAHQFQSTNQGAATAQGHFWEIDGPQSFRHQSKGAFSHRPPSVKTVSAGHRGYSGGATPEGGHIQGDQEVRFPPQCHECGADSRTQVSPPSGKDGASTQLQDHRLLHCARRKEHWTSVQSVRNGLHEGLMWPRGAGSLAVCSHVTDMRASGVDVEKVLHTASSYHEQLGRGSETVLEC